VYRKAPYNFGVGDIGKMAHSSVNMYLLISSIGMNDNTKRYQISGKDIIF
jgi:hypothetical protein